MGDKNSFIPLRAPSKDLNKYCKVCERFVAGGTIGISDSYYVTLELYYTILSCDIPVVYQLQCRNKCELQS